MKTKIMLIALAVAAFAIPTFAQEINTDTGIIDASKVFATRPPYSPPAGRTFPTRPFFGDTHLHTSLSFDAGAAGARLGPKEAYRFAKGEQVTALQRTAGEAFTTARFSRGRRSFGQHGLLHGFPCGQAGAAR